MGIVDRKVKIVLVGIGGYGNNYVKKLLDYKGQKNYEIVGAVDPYPEGCNKLEELKDNNIEIFTNLDKFYDKFTADLAIISSPIQFHLPQIKVAVSNGSNVLCEKPLTATVADAKEILRLEEEADKFVGIGYQWSFSEAILDLKKDILKGVLGSPKRLKTIILWPRNKNYFNRSSWAGRIKDDKGRWVLDSVANNATAHYLHNMFFVLGNSINESIRPQSVTAKLYRANDIENYDTAAVRVITENEVELLYLASHAIKERLDPSFKFEFEKATVYFGDYEEDSNNIVAKFKDGRVKNYGAPFQNNFKKLWMAIDAVKEDENTLPCTSRTAFSHTLCINKMQQNNIVDFPEAIINYDEDDNLLWVEELSDIFRDCYSNWSLPHERKVSWEI